MSNRLLEAVRLRIYPRCRIVDMPEIRCGAPGSLSLLHPNPQLIPALLNFGHSIIIGKFGCRDRMAERPIKGWIWPKDKPHQGGKRSRRMNLIRDIFSGQGPDIFVGRLDTLEHLPTRSRWSRWADMYPNPNNRGLPALPWADRRLQRYDFLTRRYTNFHPNMWSDTEWDYSLDGELYLRAWWDADGHRHIV